MIVEWNDAAIIAKVRQGAARGAFLGANLVHAEAVRLIMSPPKTGRIYRRRGVKHQASAPGQPPASDTGGLAGSGTVDRIEGAIASRVTFRKVYARALERGSKYQIGGAGGAEGQVADPAQREFGTQTLQARPFLRPALRNMRDQILAVMMREVRKSLGLKKGQTLESAQGDLFG